MTSQARKNQLRAQARNGANSPERRAAANTELDRIHQEETRIRGGGR